MKINIDTTPEIWQRIMDESSTFRQLALNRLAVLESTNDLTPIDDRIKNQVIARFGKCDYRDVTNKISAIKFVRELAHQYGHEATHLHGLADAKHFVEKHFCS